MATGAVQWTADQLLAELAKVKAWARAEFAAMGQNSAHMSDLYVQADSIADPAKRAAARGGLEAWANRQAGLVRDFNAAWGRYLAAYNAAASFLRSIGVNAPPDPGGLSGLGALPLVPVVVVGAVLLAAAWLAVVHENNLTQRQDLSNQAARFAAFVGGRISAGDYVTLSRADAALAEQNKKPLPGGGLQGMILPGLALVALIVLGPRLLELMPRKAAT